MRPATLGILALLLLAPAYQAQEGATAEALPLLERLDALPPTHAPAPGMASGIGPGSRLMTEIPDEGTFGCTANFVWSAGGKLYLGAAGHCFLPADRTATHGPGADYDAGGVRVFVCVSACAFGGQLGFSVPGDVVELGRVAYARQALAGASSYANDFGLVEIPSSLHASVRPQLPVWQGPTSSEPAPALGVVCLYGNSMALGETWPTMARVGVGTNEFVRDQWVAHIPVTFGDSGAALITCEADTDGLHGARPVGVITHGVPGLAYGPTIPRARTLATEAGLHVSLVTE